MALLSCTGGQEAPSLLNKTDVSPDAPFGTPQDSNGEDPSGRILSLVIDPTNDSILYAASLYSGVWKSVDGGHSWGQASAGLRSGLTQSFGGPFLAIDTINPQRLLYATDPNDGRPGTPYGGLWVSVNAAAIWRHIVLCQNSPNVYSVVFARGFPFVATDCGLWSTADADISNQSSWQKLDTGVVNPDFFAGAVLATLLNSASPTLFACHNRVVMRSSDPVTSPIVWDILLLPGSCQDLSVPPPDPTQFDVTAVVAAFQTDQGNTEICVADFNVGGCVRTLNFAQFSTKGGSGRVGVFAARFRTPPASGTPTGPLFSYDVYASDAFNFYRFHLNFHWNRLSGLHVDPWSMAFPSAYDPDNGNCTAYAANDGGVFANPIAGVGNCITDAAENGWVLASFGLHVYASDAMAGLSRPGTGPILYDPAADDEVWVSAQSGVAGTGGRWKDLRAETGDAAQVFIDPALPTRVVTGRFGGGCQITLQISKDGTPVTPDNATQALCIQPNNFGGGVQTPRLGGFSQAMTLLTEPPAPFGDYFSFERTALSNGSCKQGVARCDDRIVRNTTAGSGGGSGAWTDITFANFGPGWIGQIATAGGHSNTTIYVLTSNDPNVPVPIGNGQVWQGQIGPNGKVPFWVPRSGVFPTLLLRGYNLFVNPYDPSELYATDLGDSTIKASRDGGQSWAPVPELKDIATNHGEFIFDCGDFAFGSGGGGIFQAACPLVDVNFNRDHPEIRVAALFPGGIAFSRDYGQHWIPLHVTNADPFGSPPVYDLIEMPHSVFYDPEPNVLTNAPSIYLAVQGRGVIRVDGPFP